MYCYTLHVHYLDDDMLKMFRAIVRHTGLNCVELYSWGTPTALDFLSHALEEQQQACLPLPSWQSIKLYGDLHRDRHWDKYILVTEALIETLTSVFDDDSNVLAAAMHRRVSQGKPAVAPRVSTLDYRTPKLGLPLLTTYEGVLPALKKMYLHERECQWSDMCEVLAWGGRMTGGGGLEMLSVNFGDLDVDKMVQLERAISSPASLFRNLSILHISRPYSVEWRPQAKSVGQLLGRAIFSNGACPCLEDLSISTAANCDNCLEDIAAFIESSRTSIGGPPGRRPVLKRLLLHMPAREILDTVQQLVASMAVDVNGPFSHLQELSIDTTCAKTCKDLCWGNEYLEKAVEEFIKGARTASRGEGHDWTQTIETLFMRSNMIVWALRQNPALFPSLQFLDVGNPDSYRLVKAIKGANNQRERKVRLTSLKRLHLQW